MKKIAIIVQRYGLEVNGGAEYHCRLLAEKLKEIYEIEVLTSCAKSYISWANEYQDGLSEINGVKVRRFTVSQDRDQRKAHRLSRKLRKRSLPQKFLKFLGILSFVEKTLGIDKDVDSLSYEWSKAQGPFTEGLIVFLEKNHQDYDALVYFTYLYFPTYHGIRAAPDKAILIPTAHDEPPIYMPGFRKFFNMPKVILYNTLAEKHFINSVFNNGQIYNDVVGIGIDKSPAIYNSDMNETIDLNAPYFIYIGRIDRAKGCEMMVEYFLKYKKSANTNCKLVLVGQSFLKIPENESIVSVGFVSEATKLKLLRGAKGLIMPSFYESLSLVTLESMMEGIPVIANEGCEVLKMHVQESQSGFLFNDLLTFKNALNAIQNPNIDLSALQRNAKAYVEKNYRWDIVLKKFSAAVDYICDSR